MEDAELLETTAGGRRFQRESNESPGSGFQLSIAPKLQ